MFSPQSNRRIPILMGTQHPDNAGVPFWHDQAFIGTNHETEEIYQNFFKLGMHEYMWDWEGKFADEAMVERLHALYHKEFKEKQLGRDKFITLRVPNVWEEKSFKLARAYMSVLSAAEFTKSLGLHAPPVFELILPMTTRAEQLHHLQETFQKTAKMHQEIFGEHGFGSGYIHIIPLIEQVEDLANSGQLLKEFLEGHKAHFGELPPYLRTFIARSDPALNAGFVPAVLAARMALREFYRIGEEFNLPVYPIIGTGSLPFRGGINPKNIKKSLAQYEGVKTVTIQSGFRYDYPIEEVKEALNYIKKELEEPKKISFSDEEFKSLRELTTLFKDFYTPTVEEFAPLINEMAAFVPKRRERVQHIGLFGYSRGVGKVSLPRAIKFTGACYSYGIPPEFIGTGRGLKAAKEQGLLETLEKHFFTLRWELEHAGKYLNRDNLNELAEKYSWAKDIQEDIRLCEEILNIKVGPHKDHHHLHKNLTSNILLKRKLNLDFSDDLLESALLRRSLG